MVGTGQIVRLSDGKNKMAANFVFNILASLDRFIKKRVMNKIFFMPKRSSFLLGLFFRLSNGPAFKRSGPVENDHSKAGTVRLSDVYSRHPNTGLSG